MEPSQEFLVPGSRPTREELLWEIPWTRMPSARLWAQLNADERERIVEEVLGSLIRREEREIRRGMPESHFHKAAADDMAESLGHHFRTHNRSIFVEANLPVLYPGRAAFSPDVMAVADVRPGVRGTWIVADEGKGADLVVEVHHRGNWEKDARHNVKKYARLKIREYFLFSMTKQQLLGYRLPEDPARRRYRVLQSDEAGRFYSEVLGLSLGVEEGQVRFYDGQTRVMLRTERDAAAEQVLRQERERAERAEQEQRHAEQEQRRAEQEQRHAEQSARETQIAAILAILRARGVDTGRSLESRLRACQDPALLAQWFQRVLTGATEI